MSREELLNRIKELEQRLAVVEKENEEVVRLKERNRYLEEQIKLLNLLHFGPKSEKWSETDHLYAAMFNEAEDEAFKQTLDNIVPEPEVEKKKPAGRRKKRGKSITSCLPDNLPSIEEVYHLSEDEKICGCGAQMKHIGYDIVKRLSIKPAEITVIIEKYEKCACSQCDGIDLDEGEAPAIKRAEGKKHLIPGGIATAGLIAWSLAEKYEFALPFYRQEKRFKHIGVEISRGNLCNWAIKAAKACEPMIPLLERHIKSGSVINGDETHLQVLKEENRKAQNKSWMWLFRGGPPDKPAVLFHYEPRRNARVPELFLTGFSGWLQTDGYSAYLTALKRLNRNGNKINHTLCWAHARRRFEKSWKATKSPHAHKALDFIREIFALEGLRKSYHNIDDFTAVRKRQAEDIFNSFRKWLEELYPITVASSLLGKAMKYTLNNWEGLVNYVEHPELTPSNNSAENAIRPFVVGRKNFLFSASVDGAHSSALIFSLIESAKLYGLIPFLYLTYVFEKVPYAEKEDDYLALMPWNVTKEMINQPV